MSRVHRKIVTPEVKQDVLVCRSALKRAFRAISQRKGTYAAPAQCGLWTVA
ncbi:hypothetical protein [Tateyamaria sp.]|uniref:hypothetical protein n=1 Tax=Tateyamaria sp. TaxID=1929288 RepID=UPI0032A0454A